MYSFGLVCLAFDAFAGHKFKFRKWKWKSDVASIKGPGRTRIFNARSWALCCDAFKKITQNVRVEIVYWFVSSFWFRFTLNRPNSFVPFPFWIRFYFFFIFIYNLNVFNSFYFCCCCCCCCLACIVLCNLLENKFTVCVCVCWYFFFSDALDDTCVM